jgi:hypothetical protein
MGALILYQIYFSAAISIKGSYGAAKMQFWAKNGSFLEQKPINLVFRFAVY